MALLFQLVERSGLSNNFIGKVERGTTSPSIESLRHIADALDISLHDLFAGDREAVPPQPALVELIRLCRERANADIEMLVGIAQLIFQRMRGRAHSNGESAGYLVEQGLVRGNPGEGLPKYLSSVERGEENPTLDLFLRLAKGPQVDLYELFQFEHEGGEARRLRKKLEGLIAEIKEEELARLVRVLEALLH